MRFCSLGSGSGGNATVIEAREGTSTTRLLVDCGFSLRELERRVTRAGLSLGDIDAVFITHEHGDHVGCAVALARRHRIPLWMSRGTWQAIGEPDLPGGVGLTSDGCACAVGGLQLHPFAVPHDAREPLQLRCEDGARRIGILTDAGSITPNLLAQLQGCDALLLECNHDRDLLAASSYPASVKTRIGGHHGHLANDTAADILAACWHPAVQHVVAAHLSERTNRPDHARVALAAACSAAAHDIVVADPREGFGWLDLH